MLGADTAWPLWQDAPIKGAFAFEDDIAADEAVVITSVVRPWLLGYAPERPNGRAMLVLAGGGYVQLMAGREGMQIARWLTGLGYHAYVLIHRFPDALSGIAAPLQDARRAMRLIRAHGQSEQGVGVVGLSSGGHLAACLAAEYPAEWPESATLAEYSPRPDAMVIGYAPISTNAKGRTLRPNKPPLPPVEKQAMYDRLQPDAQMLSAPPPAFIVYSANDPVVPVENAYRLHAALLAAEGSAELHVFADAPHGFALDTVDLPASAWPQLCEGWLRQTGFL